MAEPFVIYISLTWAAVFFYVLATTANVYGIIFKRDRVEKLSYILCVIGLAIHSIVILYWWYIVGHGPYMAPSEVFSSDSWIVLVLFLIFNRLYPKIKPTSIFVFPSTFLLLALGLFYNPGIRTLPPTFASIWLVFHIAFYKIALATVVIAVAFSVFFILKKRMESAWLQRLPVVDIIDMYAYRFAGFGFIFWAIAMLAGSIWAYQSWGRFWGWDPVETWSLITWIIFGIYLHLRRFFGWQGEKAAWFYIVCFVLSLVSVFYTSHLSTSIHAEYFK
ncbi:MAG: cytochrome c biogenesis protein CcsA [Nitrospirae bacterium]|nr:cytochrome c biogenesis protein CcsA [Nitrospirota bacterium]